jgi:hypothetical protein
VKNWREITIIFDLVKKGEILEVTNDLVKKGESSRRHEKRIKGGV